MSIRYAAQVNEALSRLSPTERQAALEIIRHIQDGRGDLDGTYVQYGSLVWVSFEVRGGDFIVTNVGLSIAGMM